ncbi:MAG: DUF3108 domain-containing protein [Nitrospirae bacterium]|nr:MAG: DUF3108 domain-containing protein [Nitrospirota bacterium]
MERKIALLCFITFLLLTSFLPSEAVTKKEVFRYDLKWIGIKAGTATLSFIYDNERVTVSSRAESADWVSVFYRVDDRAKSTLTKRSCSDGTIRWLSENYRLKIREGRHRRDKETLFLHDPPKARFIDHLEGEEKLFDITDDTYDPLSGFFILRQKEIKDGKDIFLKLFDSKKLYDARVKVLGKERVKTRAGTFETVAVEPELKSEGIFQRKGKVVIYLTDDERHIPVLLKSKVLIGSVVAELTEIEEVGSK